MREHPLLMRPELVVASLAGRKWQTRRLVTPATSEAHDDAGKASREDWSRMDWASACVSVNGPALIVSGVNTTACQRTTWRVTPRVRPGDALYVRETWQTGSALDDEAPAMLAAWAATAGLEPCGPVRYVADGATRDEHLVAPGSHYGDHWGRKRPGIHLPRWASRLVLPVASVRVERVQSISEADAIAEGVGSDVTDLRALDHLRGAAAVRAVPSRLETARDRFRAIWDKINADRAPWAANPWTWVYEWPPVGGQP